MNPPNLTITRTPDPKRRRELHALIVKITTAHREATALDSRVQTPEQSRTTLQKKATGSNHGEEGS